MALLVGSARHDENGKYSGGAAGDQDGTEVSTQAFYVHTKGWYVLRPKSVEHANAIANKMLRACANNNIGYDQNNRLGIVKYGIETTTKTEADCSSTVRECVKEATGIDPGNFTTANEATMLANTGLFMTKFAYTTSTVLYDGDVLVTKTKGHTVIVVSGNPRVSAETTYTIAQFISDSRTIWGVSATASAAEILAKTITVSTLLNPNHAIVTPLERLMKAYGYYNGAIEADQKKTPCFGDNMKTAIKLYQKNVVKASIENQDGELTAKGATWKKLYGA